MLAKILSFTLGLFLMSCASTPIFDTTQAELSLTPQSVIAEPMHSLNKVALWGGTILNTQNLKNSTQIEMLAYPLSSSQRPLVDSKPLGRFIIRQQGFLEPANYAQGRLLTVLGSVSESETGTIGESSYQYPVVNARQLQLWSPQKDKTRSSFRFGLGLRL